VLTQRPADDTWAAARVAVFCDRPSSFDVGAAVARDAIPNGCAADALTLDSGAL